MTEGPRVHGHLRNRGSIVVDNPYVSQFTLGGGGVYCVCQPQKRD